MPLYEESFTGLCDQNLKDTIQLKQRYLDTKAKRVPKSKDKKQQDSIQGSVHVQQKFLKRPSEDQHDPGGGTNNPQDNFEPPVKLQCTSSHPNEGLNKFSVEIVQHLEFTTSAANSQPQQISTNVTVKAHTNTSVKSDVSSPKSSNPATPQQQQQQQQQTKNNINLDVGTLVDCVKQEPDNDFADLNLIGDDTNDEIITSDAFNDLFSDMSNYPEIMKDFDFDDKPESSASANGLKVEDSKDGNQSHGATNDVTKSTHSSAIGQQNQNFSLNSSAFENKNRQMPPYSNMDFAKTELSPAAQTLKQMAEQHQHKNQMGLSFNPNHPNRSSNPRSPYPDFQFQNDYVSGSPNPNPPQFKNSPSFSSPDLIKQEMIYQGSEFDMKRKGAPPGMYKQQYSPYSSPSASSHGSPGYLPRSANAGNPPPPGGGAFGGGTPPRPPSGPGGNNNGTTLQINQAQQLHISQQSHGHNIQVSAGQHLQLSGDLKGNVSIATHQGMHFNQQSHPSNTNTSQSNTSNSQMGPNSAQNNHPGSASSQMNQQGPPMSGQGMSAQMGPQGGLGNNLQGPGGMGQGPTSVGQGGMGQNGMQGSLPPNMQGMAGNMQGSMPNSMQSGLPMQGNTMGSSIGNNGMIGGPQMQHGNMAGNHPGSMNESYSMTQTQTINFTQQTLRQRTGPNVMPNSMGPNVPMNQNTMSQQHAMTQQRMLNAQQSIEQQKLLQQQQMLRQAAMQQHGMVRPPPPDYKSSAGIMQPRYAAAGPPNIRRMPHQSMPPSGPMIRPHNMYMVQQQQAAAQQQAQQMGGRNMYPRQQGPSSMETMQHHGSAEWRHILMQQQQNANFNPQMRPHFQNSFNMNPNNMQQMTALQHQQMRSQQQAGMVPSNMGGGQQSMGQSMGQAQMMNQGNGPMAQMTSMNQQMLAMQQQQSLMQHQQQQQQQQNSMSMTSIHMQQSQSLSMSNQSMTPSQQQHQNSLNNQLVNNPSSNTNQNNSLSNFTPPNTDFSLEFLDNLSTTDSGAFTDQELLNSFDTDAGFNLDF